MRRMILAFVTCALAALLPVAPAAATTQARPFHGHLVGQAVVDVAAAGSGCTNPPLQTTSQATGTVTHLGLTTMTAQHCTPTYDTIDSGLMTLSAANGDQLYLHYSGTCSPPPFPPTIECHLTYTVTGGTGRFSNAGGSGTIYAAVKFSGSLDLPTLLPGDWFLHGALSY